VRSSHSGERLSRSDIHTSGEIDASVEVRAGERSEPVATETAGQTTAGYGNLLVPPPRPPGATTTIDDWMTSPAQEEEEYQRLTSNRQQYIDRAGSKRLRGG